MNDEEMDEAVLSKNVLHSDHARDKQTPNGHDNAYQNRLIRRQKLSMVDLETALSYMLRREIPRYKDIRGEAYDALVHWLIVLTKVGFQNYFHYFSMLVIDTKSNQIR